METYKITIEDGKNSYHFYTSNLEDGEYGLLDGAFFNSQIVDAKTLERFTIKEKILDGLKLSATKE